MAVYHGSHLRTRSSCYIITSHQLVYLNRIKGALECRAILLRRRSMNFKQDFPLVLEQILPDALPDAASDSFKSYT